MKYNKKKMATDFHMFLYENRMTLREAKDKTGISAATLSRVQNQYTPDLITYATVCKLMGKSLDTYIK